MFLKIAAALGALLVVFLIYVAVKPSHYEIRREIAINAPAEKIFPFLNSSRRANQWMPWGEQDPQAQMSYSGPEEGVGSKASWQSPGRLGTGSCTIVDLVPNQKVGMKLEYVKPMTMEQRAEYAIRAEGAANVVSWTVTGENNFLGRLMCTFMNMDDMVGKMFEKGLANLKAMVEKAK